MADTVESLRAELDALRTAFEEFKVYAQPVIDSHQQPGPDVPRFPPMLPLPRHP